MGGFHLQTKEEFDCTPFDDIKGSIIQGDEYTCESKVSNPESKDEISGGGSNNDDDGEEKTDDAGRLAVGSILGLTMAVAFVVSF